MSPKVRTRRLNKLKIGSSTESTEGHYASIELKQLITIKDQRTDGMEDRTLERRVSTVEHITNLPSFMDPCRPMRRVSFGDVDVIQYDVEEDLHDIRVESRVLGQRKQNRTRTLLISQREKFVYSQLELFCLQLSFFAYSPLRPLSDALSHCKQKSSNCK